MCETTKGHYLDRGIPERSCVRASSPRAIIPHNPGPRSPCFRVVLPLAQSVVRVVGFPSSTLLFTPGDPASRSPQELWYIGAERNSRSPSLRQPETGRPAVPSLAHQRPGDLATPCSISTPILARFPRTSAEPGQFCRIFGKLLPSSLGAMLVEPWYGVDHFRAGSARGGRPKCWPPNI